MSKRILFISGSVGLGHVVRDLAVAEELRKQKPDIKLFWLASEPAATVLRESGEKIVPEVEFWAQESDIMEKLSEEYSDKGKNYNVNLAKYLFNSKQAWSNNVKVFKQLVDKGNFDLIIGDESYEIAIALRDHLIQIKPTFVMFYDFIGLDTMTKNPLEKLIVYKVNKGWAMGYKSVSERVINRIFIGELEDVPDRRFGFLLPNRREIVKNKYNVVGYVLSFDPADYIDKQKIRKKLGYGNESLVICSVGGTKVGQPLLEMCIRNYPLLKEKIPELKMVIVCGLRIKLDTTAIPDGLEIKEYLPELYKHFAVCDLAIVQGGGTTTLELTALNRPFIYFPIEGHSEQQKHIAPRVTRHSAGVKMKFSKTTPESLLEAVSENIGKVVNYNPIRIDGSKKIAKIVISLLNQ
jgi:UDP-N-acetylglucosamine:LPS N-acetylglucosamine transferase